MTEKDNVSIATVQMKTDYAPSEVYSTASEPPPAYKRQANSVKIAKIVAYTVIASTLILGTFILASVYLQAKASCDQVQALDSVLEKELVLETLQQANREIPKAEALIGNDNESDLDKVQKTDEKLNDIPMSDSTSKDNDSSDSSFSDSDESTDMKPMHKQVPVDLDLTELAAAILQNNQKSKMNCVVERKRIVEDVDRPARNVALPFGVNIQMEPKKAQITGERIAIFCDRGDEEKVESRNKKESDDESNEENDIESIKPLFMQRFPMPYGRIPQQNPLTHMPQILAPQTGPFRPMPFAQFRPPIPAQFMQPPQQSEHERPQTAHLRIQLQPLPIREIHMAQDIPVQISSNAGAENREIQQAPNSQVPQIQIQRVPLGVALQRAGITADDLRNIQRMAEERITEELRRFANEESSSSESNEESSNENEEPQPHSRVAFPSPQSLPLLPVQPQPPVPKESLTAPENTPIIPIGRAAYGRSLQHPINIPISIIQQSEEPQQQSSEQKPHIVQPRSVE